jgi:hypothetical protein
MAAPDAYARRWLRPPRLRTLAKRESERHASWLELFFDLVLVVAIAQLAAPPMRQVFVARWFAAAALLAIPSAARGPLGVAATALVVLVALVVYEGVMCAPIEPAHGARD